MKFNYFSAASSGLLTDLPSADSSANLSLASVLISTQRKSLAGGKLATSETPQPATRSMRPHSQSSESGSNNSVMLHGFCSQRHKEVSHRDEPVACSSNSLFVACAKSPPHDVLFLGTIFTLTNSQSVGLSVYSFVPTVADILPLSVV